MSPPSLLPSASPGRMLAPSPSPRKAVMRCWTRTCATPRIASRGATFMSRLAPLLFLALPLWLGGCATVLHEQALVTEEFMVPSADPGIELYVRNKRPASESRFPGERIVLFVHGSTYPAETALDLPLNGVSWMAYIARQGYDVDLVDLRGYGRPTRPPEMDQPAERNALLTTTSTAAKDVGRTAEFIRKRDRKSTRLNSSHRCISYAVFCLKK